jgi:hypothetical protein
MEQQEIIEGNLLLAAFDGWKLRDEPYVNSNRESFPWWEKLKDGEVIKTYHHDILSAKGRFEYGSYHSSWDWIMPVVERIESLHSIIEGKYINIRISQGYVEIEGANERIFYNCSIEGSKITTVYKGIIDFIKWYNTQPTKSNQP